MHPRRRGAYLDGASQPAMSPDIRGAIQPAGDMQHAYRELTPVSFSFGVQQSMMASVYQREERANKLAFLLSEIGEIVNPDFFFGGDVGDDQQGFSRWRCV